MACFCTLSSTNVHHIHFIILAADPEPGPPVLHEARVRACPRGYQAQQHSQTQQTFFVEQKCAMAPSLARRLNFRIHTLYFS